jgi:uncharacterized iron-regulated protein
MHPLTVFASPLLLFVSAAVAQEPTPARDRATPPQWRAPELSRAVAVRNGRTGEPVELDTMLDALATADAVFVGETHTDETTHRVELAVLQGVAERRSDKVVLAMEMFERDVQPVIDRYLSGKTSEREFLAKSRPWANYDTGYRPLIEFAKQRGLTVVASNFPKWLSRRLAMSPDGPSLDNLDGRMRALAPDELFANAPAYWRRVDNAIRGHLGMMRSSRDDDERLYAAQSLWDNAMGEACAKALEAHPGSSVVHVNGGFHSAYWDGTVRQFRQRRPQAKVLTVAVSPAGNPAVAKVEGVPRADFVVFAEARATDVNEGMHSVYVQREVKYRLHLPPRAGNADPVPLLIWLADDGLSAADGMALWRDRLGDECAIAVVEAPFRETQRDLLEGGRWFWPDSFAEDLGAMVTATDRIWAFLMRHHAIDGQRVCLAGEGTGATVVTAASVLSSRMSANAVAFLPRHYAKLKDIPLPLPEFRGDAAQPRKSLRLLLGTADETWWRSEFAEYEKIGMSGGLSLQSDDAWQLALDQENALRAALGLKARQLAVDAVRRHVPAARGRARYWARLLAARTTAATGALVAVVEPGSEPSGSQVIDVAVTPNNLAARGGVPPCPGPFGGTTVMVLPPAISPETVAAWRALEADDPLRRRSRFHRLRIATQEGEHGLPAVLADLAAKGRKNVLIVPAVFCADAEWMHTLAESVREQADRMTLRWRPGLGGRRSGHR